MPQPSDILSRIRANPKVPAPSQALFKILELTRDADCNMAELASVIAQDGGITAHLLREANSALYGFDKPSSTVADACMRLGLKRVRSAVLSRHVVDGLTRAKPPGFDAHRYWQSTFAQSVAAKSLCTQVKPDAAESAAIAGLLCDIGIGLLAFGIGEAYQEVLNERQRTEALPLHEIERRRLGLTHADVGGAVLQDWRLDKGVIEAVMLHHADPKEPALARAAPLARIVAASALLARIALEGSDMERVGLLFEYVETLTSDPDALIERLLDGLVSRIQDSAEIMGVELGSTDGMEARLESLLKSIPDTAERFSHRPMARELFEGAT